MILTSLQFFGDSSSGLGSLGVSGSAFVIQLITFVLAYIVLRRYAFGPILKILKERRDTIAEGVKLGEDMRKERIELDEKVKKELVAARVAADAIVSDADASAKESIHKAESKAQEKADIILAEAKAQTKQEMARAKRQLEGEIVGLVAEATEVLTGEKVDAKKDGSLINKAIAGQLK
jgi:F-type H+-transporting ATPase subunit b